MSEENVEVVRRAFDAFARRDPDAVLALYDPDVEWDASRTQLGDLQEVFRGHDGLRRFFRQWLEAWDSDASEYDELIDSGEAVVSIISQRVRGRASGVQVTRPLAGVWTVRDRRIVRVVWYPSSEDALEAAGLRE